MENLMSQIGNIINTAASVLGGIVVLATAIVRITKTKSDDAFVDLISGKLWKALNWLPTIGINPRTKALEAAYLEEKSKHTPKS